MKKIIFLLPIFGCLSTFGQLQNTTAPTDVFMHYRVSSKNGKQLSYDDIKGSPYISKDFKLAKIGDEYETISARYNAYTDEIEFKKGSSIYVLPQNKDFDEINFLNSTEKLTLINGVNDLSGYYFVLAGDKNSLLKKEKVTFVDVIPSSSSYESDKPAKFQTQKPMYFIKVQNGNIKQVLNANDVYNLYPDMKQNLNKFIKAEKIKFSNENDLIKLLNYLNSI